MHKIGHLIMSKNFAGIEQHVDEITNEINQSSKYHCVVIGDKILKEKFKSNKYINFQNKYRYSIFNLVKLKRIIKNNNIQILHCHGSKSMQIGNLIKMVTNIKIIGTLHSLKKRPVNLQKFDYIISVNQALKPSSEKSSVVNNWINPKLRLATSSRNGSYIAVGRLEKVKRFDLLINAWKEIDEDLIIIGDGNEINNLQNLIKENNSTNIKILTKISTDQLSEMYSQAKGLIVSSSREGGPRVAIEALAYGVPVFGCNVGMLEEIITKELLVDPNKEDEFVKLIRDTLPHIQNYSFDALQDMILEKFTVARASLEHIGIYDYLVSND